MSDFDEMNRSTPRFASGGILPKGGKVPVVLEPGVVVLTEQAAKALNAHGFERINIQVNGKELVAMETGTDAKGEQSL